jgi:hypothetical protein
MKFKSLVFLVALISQHLIAQESTFWNKSAISFKTGFTIPAASTTVGSPREEVGNEFLRINKNGEFSQKSSTGSRGAGYSFSGSFSYMFNDNFGVDVELSYLRSSNINDAFIDIDTSNVEGKRYFAEQTSFTKMFRIAPMIVVQGNKEKKFQPYAKFGLLMPLFGATYINMYIDDETGLQAYRLLPVINPGDIEIMEQNFGIFPPIPTESTVEAKTLGAFSLGFASRFGVNMKVGEKISVFAELESNMLSVKAKNTEVTKFRTEVSNKELADFANSIGITTVYNTEDIPNIIINTNYVDEVNQNSNRSFDTNAANFDKNKPLEQKSFRDNYNSFGLFVGVKYSF